MSRARDTGDNGHLLPQRRNLLINGEMRVWQRGTAFTAVAPDDFSVDRLMYAALNDAVIDIAQGTTSVSDDLPFDLFVEIDVTTADASIAVGQYATVAHFIEGYDVEFLKLGKASAKTMTLSFYHKHTKTGTYCVSFRNATDNRSYVAEYTQTTTDTWEQATITLTGDVAGTWLQDSGIGLRIDFVMASGTDFHQAADSWMNLNSIATSNQVNALDSVSNFIRFGGMRLEVGSEASEVDPRPYGEELALCQRYYQFFIGLLIGNGYGASTTSIRITLPTAVKMRDTPTAAAGNGSFSSTLLRYPSNDLTATGVSVLTYDETSSSSPVLLFTVASGGVVLRPYVLSSTVNGIELSSEMT